MGWAVSWRLEGSSWHALKAASKSWSIIVVFSTSALFLSDNALVRAEWFMKCCIKLHNSQSGWLVRSVSLTDEGIEQVVAKLRVCRTLSEVDKPNDLVTNKTSWTDFRQNVRWIIESKEKLMIGSLLFCGWLHYWKRFCRARGLSFVSTRSMFRTSKPLRVFWHSILCQMLFQKARFCWVFLGGGILETVGHRNKKSVWKAMNAGEGMQDTQNGDWVWRKYRGLVNLCECFVHSSMVCTRECGLHLRSCESNYEACVFSSNRSTLLFSPTRHFLLIFLYSQ